MLRLKVLDGVTGTSSVPKGRATGSIQCIAKASHVDGETVTIGDGTTSVVFEFDVAGNGVTAGRTQVNISTDTTAAEVASRLATAINASALGITAIIDGTTAGLLLLRADGWGTAQNVTITEAVADAGFTVSGMSGGTLSGVKLWKESPDGEGLWRGTDKALLKVTAMVDNGQTGVLQLRAWGGDNEIQEFAPMGVGADATKGTIDAETSMAETDTDRIEHTEVITGLARMERFYMQRVTMTKIARLDVVLLPMDEYALR